MRKKMFHKYHSTWITLLSWNVLVVWLLSLEAVVAANGSKSPSFGAIPSLGGESLVVDHHNIRPIDQDPRIQAAATSGDYDHDDHDHEVVVDVDDGDGDGDGGGDDGATAAAVVLIPEPESILQPGATTTSKQKRSQPTSPTQAIQPKQQREQPQSDPITFNMGTFPSIESLLADENFTNFLENFSAGSPLPSDYSSGSAPSLNPSSLFNSQYFLPSSNTPSGSLYPVDLNNLLPPPPPSSASNQYLYNGQQQHNYNYHPNNNGGLRNNNNNINGNGNGNSSNKTSSGLGRRIGELVSNSAERATRALKSFPKLLNDIKPSKLWAWSSVVDTDLTPKHNISSIPFHSISSAWYSPQNTWSSFAPPPITSSVYFQQPVFVRTHDANPTTMQSPSAMQTNQILSPSTSSSSSPSSSASSLLSSSSSVSSATGNGNRFLSQQNVYPNTNDLYASAQTVYGNRVKPPTTAHHQFGEYDTGSNEDINSIGPGSGDSDDTKMANEGQLNDHMEEQGRINTMIMPQDHNGIPNNNDPNNNNNQNNNGGGVWPQRQPPPQPPSTTYEDYGEPGNNQQDYYYNHQSAANGNNNGLNGFQNSVRFPTNRRPQATTTSSQAYRRPYNNWDMDDLESWYPTSFFGASTNTLKPMASRFRPSSSSTFTTNSLLAAASTTPTATSVAAADYLPFVSTAMFPRQSDQITAAAAAAGSPASYYPIAPVGPRWPFTGFYPQAGFNPGAGFNPFLNHNGVGAAGYYGYRPLATANSMMRPVSVMHPFYPQMNNYYRPYRPAAAAPFVGSASTLYGSYALNPFLNTGGLVNPYRPTFNAQVSPFNSLVAAASSLYPVRVPFPAIQPSPLSYQTIIPAPITSMPILRHRIGTIKSKRQQPNDWKRNDLMAIGSEHPKYSKKPQSKSPSSSSTLSLTENRNPKQQSKQQQRSNDNDDQQLASIYKTMRMFQSKPSLSSSSVVMGEGDEQNENNHRPVFSFLNQPPSEYRYYLNNHTQHYDHKNHVQAEPATTKTTTTPSSSSQSASIDQIQHNGGGQSPPSSSSSSSEADTTTTTTTTNSSPSFRLMRAHRHIGQKQADTKTIQDNKIPRKTINPKWSDPIGSNEWKPLFRSLLRPTTTSSSSTKLDH